MRLVVFISVFILLSIHPAFTQTGSILHDGISRSYLLHLPAGFSANDTLPLVFSLHGLTMTAQMQSDLSEFNPIADRERFIVVYPQGLPNAGLNAWNAFTYNSGVDDVGFIAALIDELYALYHIDLDRVYSCGMSNGGFMSYRLACDLSDKIAAIASVTGSMIDSVAFHCSTSRPYPILHFHGTADPIVDYNGAGNIRSVTTSLSYWVQNNNCSSNPVETQLRDIDTSDHTTATQIYWESCDGNVDVIHYRINGGGHTWPGNPQDFFGVGGNINLDVMASEVIWEFFKKYTLPEKVDPVSISTFQPNQPTIYPNPAPDVITVTSEMDIDKITITDLAGKVLRTESVKGKNHITFSLKQLPVGMLFLNVQTGEVLYTHKILRVD